MMKPDQTDFPVTVDAAARTLRGLVSPEEQAKICSLNEYELVSLHWGLGQWVRNNFGLWGSNPALLNATGKEGAEDASEVILREFWRSLRDALAKLH
jgi:hypothetical protein